jgi:hypothetical protein
MNRLLRPRGTASARHLPSSAHAAGIRQLACVLSAALVAAIAASAQVTIDTKTGAIKNTTSGEAGTVDRRFAQIQPTHVALTNTELDAKTRLEIIRIMQSEQGFAMRPFPRGRKGLTLVANGKLEPAGEGYLNMVTAEGLSAKPGDRVVLTDVKIEHSKIVFDLNGGPDRKHRFLRHIQLGTGPMMGPVVQDDGQDPTGARLTLAFQGHLPDLTGSQVKELLSPLISFDMKTPVQAYTDTLPKVLKDAILDHHVLVGMNTDMVLFAMGQPDNKSREVEGQMPFEEWIYGKPPKDVEFVRINGNRVIRVEVAKVGQDPEIFTKDEVEGLMRTDGTPLDAGNTRTVALGDTQRNPDTQAPAPTPTLRAPGEKLPSDDDKDKQNGRVGVMRPVQFPKSTQDGEQTDGSQPGSSTSPSGTATTGSATASSGSGTSGGTQSKPADAQPPAGVQAPPADASQPGTQKPQPPPASQQNLRTPGN